MSRLDGSNLNHKLLDSYRAPNNDDVPDADVIVATWWETAEWVAALAPAKGAKAYFVQDHEIFDYLPVDRAKGTYRFPLHKIVVSEWLQNMMEVEYNDFNCSLVANSVDHDLFKGGDRNKNSRLTVGFLYTQVPRKSVDIAIESIIRMRKIDPTIRVLCFGTQKPDKNLPLPSWVEFQHNPPQDEIPRIYASCDVWLFSSKSEGFGLPILEAMACGTPVIGTSAGAAPQYINERTGALVEGTPEAFVEQILKFADMDEKNWKQKSDNCIARVWSYTWADASLLFEAALQNAIKNQIDTSINSGGLPESTSSGASKL